MYKIRFYAPVLVGLIAGQLFAESERPFKVVNTVRVGYSDNIYRSSHEEGGLFVTDIIDLSFRAALSDRTDITAKSQINILTDTGNNQMQPNLYLMLNHSITPRLLLGLSEYYRSGDKSSTEANATNGTKNTRYNYFYNNVGATADYVLTGKDRLTASANFAVLRHEKELDQNDYITTSAGVSWKRELSPHRTFLTVGLLRTHVNYDKNRSQDGTNVDVRAGVIYTNVYLFANDDKAYDQTDLSVGLSHTFNQKWQGHVDVGVSYVQRDFSSYTDDETSSTNSSHHVTTNDFSSTLNPIFKAGLVYVPSPRTRFTGDLSLTHQESDDNGYGGQDTAELMFGAQHDLTGKLTAKAVARFASVAYDAEDDTTGEAEKRTEDRMDLDFRLSYKLNRIHFLEAGVRHRETNRDTGNSWSENRVDVGWRVELN